MTRFTRSDRSVRFAGGAGLLWGLLTAGTLAAQTSYPMISHLHPAGARRGTTVEITASGKGNFAGATALLVDGNPADIKAEFLPDTTPAAAAGMTRFRLTVAPDAPVGLREVRILTPRGASTIALLSIGDEPEALEAEPNDLPGAGNKGALHTLPVVINGSIEKNEDVDWYRFHAEAGTVVTAHVLSQRLQDKIHDLQEHSDPMLTVTDAAGRELAGGDDLYVADPHVTFRVPATGEYRVCVRDVRYQGNRAWTYRLHLTTRPWVRVVRPLAVEAGRPTAVTPVGPLLPAGSVMVKTAADAAGVTTQQLTLASGTSNPVALWASDLPVFEEGSLPVEAPPVAAQPKAATPAPAPTGPPARVMFVGSVVNGRLDTASETDGYAFQAKAGTVYEAEVISRRLGTELHGVLTLHDGAGRQLATNDGAALLPGGPLSKDARITWTAPADGVFRLRLTDLHGRCGAEYGYALRLRRLTPGFTIRCDTDKAQVGPGTSTTWYAIVERIAGFAGPVTVEVRDLPPGVTAAPLTIPAHLTTGSLVVSAAADAKPVAGHVSVVGIAEVPGPDGKPARLEVRSVPIQEIYLPGGGRGRFPVGLQTVAVTTPSDLTLVTPATAVTLERGKTVRIEVAVKRAPGYTGPVTLDFPLRHLETVYANPLPTGVTIVNGQSRMRLGPKDDKGWILLQAAADAPATTDLPVAVMGYVSINFVVKVGYSTPAIRLTVK